MPDHIDNAVARALDDIERELNTHLDLHQAIVVRNVLHRLVDETNAPQPPWPLGTLIMRSQIAFALAHPVFDPVTQIVMGHFWSPAPGYGAGLTVNIGME